MPPDPYKYFRIEARELLDQLGRGVLQLEAAAPARQVIPGLLRAAHTLKGAARVVRQPEIAGDAHGLEDLLSAVDVSGEGVSGPQIQAMLALVDSMDAQLATLSHPDAPAAPTQDRAPNEADGRQPLAAEDALPAFRPDPEDIDGLARSIAAVGNGLRVLEASLVETDAMRHLADVIIDHVDRRSTRTDLAQARDGGQQIMPVLQDLRRRLAAVEREWARRLGQIARDVDDATEATARLRLVPAGAVFRFLERATRDAAHAVGKQARFESHGGDVRLDPEILALAQGALLHLVRNAVVHGIEPNPDARRAAGKSPEATVTVSVSRKGQHISFACTDDGSGVDLEKVRQALERKGQIAAGESLDSAVLLQRLLHGGVSTTGSITAMAGRGVGLDVVRATTERLGGHATMRSTPGAGTSVEIVVPVALASLQALLVETAGIPAAVPLDVVTSTLRVRPELLVHTPQGPSIVHEGKSIPVTSLQQIVAPHERPPQLAGQSAFVVTSGEGTAAFTVDRIVHAARVTVAPLPELAPAASVVVGTSVDNGQHPRLILDGLQLLGAMRRVAAHAPAASQAPPAILVIDDSLTTRMLEQSILESAGYTVRLATSGEEGLQMARNGAYALFLVDVEMPGMDGFTFVEHIRADPALRATPAILVTSRAAAEDRERGSAVGANAYVIKSEFDQGVLLAHIRTLVQTS